MASTGTETVWAGPRPDCDICKATGMGNTPAEFDAKSRLNGGQWAAMCERHFQRYGIGLGVGLGQRIVSAQGEGGGASSPTGGVA